MNYSKKIGEIGSKMLIFYPWNRRCISVLLMGLILILNSCRTKNKSIIESDFEHIGHQLSLAVSLADSNFIKVNPKSGRDPIIPRSISPEHKMIYVGTDDWCSGFFPGSLWYMYEYTKDPKWEEAAKKYTAMLEQEKNNKSTHDLGFMMYCSYGNGYRINKDSSYRKILLQTAMNLKSRYNPKLKVIRSWDFGSDVWQFPVIIDNMMNLELLFWAFRETRDSSYFNVALNHALTTKNNHFRADYSTYHVVDYDTITGHVRQKMTHQGYSDESAWARGQAWALYGYAMCYRETGRTEFLDQAKNVANFLNDHQNMPPDRIPYWDFNSPKIPDEPRDASAAAIIASALFDLCKSDAKNQGEYKKIGDKIIQNLSDNYLVPQNKLFGFILNHSTGSKPHHSEVDVPLSYADYYFLEALIRKSELDKNHGN
ncbi:MAG: glycoside hydrolase family 88 protein [Sphingobacterium sp.]|nr:glycoside hydrolase family 88 protein [Sphingobacterium sp.]